MLQHAEGIQQKGLFMCMAYTESISPAHTEHHELQMAAAVLVIYCTAVALC